MIRLGVILSWLLSALMQNAEKSISEAGYAVINEMGSNHGWDIIWENSSPKGLILLARLRAILNRNQQGMKVIFSGSSFYGLREVFADKSAPLFRFAVPLNFLL